MIWTMMTMRTTVTSIMMALDLYEPLMKNLSSLNFWVLGMAIPGIVVTVVLLARLVNWLFGEHYAVAFHGILGVVIASTLVIIPTAYTGMGEMLLSAVCCAGGFSLALFLGRLDRRIFGKAHDEA